MLHIQRFGDDDPQTYTTSTPTYTTQTYTTSTPTYTTQTQTHTTATPATDSPTLILVTDKTLVDKEHAEQYVRKTIQFAKKHFLSLDNLKIVSDKDVDDFFDKLEKEMVDENSDSKDDSDIPSDNDGGDDNTSQGSDDNNGDDNNTQNPDDNNGDDNNDNGGE